MANTQWVQLSMRVEPELVEPITELFNKYAEGSVAVEEAGGFNPDDGEVRNPAALVNVVAYYPNNRRAAWRRNHIDMGLKVLALITKLPKVQERIAESKEWEESWKLHFPVLELNNLLIVPPWVEPEPKEGQIVVRLDPGLAFGTGHHPTTRRCLLALPELTHKGDRVLDLGCGSGILGLAALKLGASEVVGLDTEAEAITATRQNSRMNRLGRKFPVSKGTLPYSDIGTFDSILANISSKMIIGLAPHFKPVMKPGGVFVGSGILAERCDEVVAALNKQGLKLRHAYKDGDWSTIVCTVA